MLVHGTCNPTGEGHAVVDRLDYNGVYLRTDDIARIVTEDELVGKPVLMEHYDDTVVGEVVSAWEHAGQLDVLVHLETDELWGSVAGACVSGNWLKDFSLGYKVQMSAAPGAAGPSACVGHKTLVEVSLVKQGARANCHIKNYAM